MTEFRLKPYDTQIQYAFIPWTNEAVLSSVDVDFYTRKIIPGTLRHYPAHTKEGRG